MDDLDDTYRRACEGLQRVHGLVVPSYDRHGTGKFYLLWHDFGLASDLRNAWVPMSEIERLLNFPARRLHRRWSRWFPELNDPRTFGTPDREPPNRNRKLDEIEAALARDEPSRWIRAKYSLNRHQLSGIKLRWKRKKEQLIV